MTINTSHANITGGITNDILNILDITDSLYTNDTNDTIDDFVGALEIIFDRCKNSSDVIYKVIGQIKRQEL